jgi:hypothetical protein
MVNAEDEELDMLATRATNRMYYGIGLALPIISGKAPGRGARQCTQHNGQGETIP